MVCSFFSSPRRFQRDRSGRAAHLPRLHPHHQATVQRGHSDHQGQWRGLIAGSTVYHRMIYTHTHTQEYAFTASLYPLIISIENHCSSAQQAKMAKIFQVCLSCIPSFLSIFTSFSLTWTNIYILREKRSTTYLSLFFVHSRCSMIMYAEQHKA